MSSAAVDASQNYKPKGHGKFLCPVNAKVGIERFDRRNFGVGCYLAFVDHCVALRRQHCNCGF